MYRNDFVVGLITINWVKKIQFWKVWRLGSFSAFSSSCWFQRQLHCEWLSYKMHRTTPPGISGTVLGSYLFPPFLYFCIYHLRKRPFRKMFQNFAYAVARNHLDRRNWAVVPLKLSNGTARIEQSHRSGWIWTERICQCIINMAGVRDIRCPAGPFACAWIPYRQWPQYRHRGRSGRRWHQPEAGQTVSPAIPGSTFYRSAQRQRRECSIPPEWLLNLSGRGAQSHAEYSNFLNNLKTSFI